MTYIDDIYHENPEVDWLYWHFIAPTIEAWLPLVISAMEQFFDD